MTKTNVLFVTLDQWRADHLAATGNPTIQTPTMDALCADGVTFRNHFTCIAPCGPSRTTFLTGMYPSNHRSIRNGTPLNHSLTNLAFEARTAGYDPTLWGYTDTTPDPRVLGEDHEAFLTYEGVMPGFSVGQRPVQAVFMADIEQGAATGTAPLLPFPDRRHRMHKVTFRTGKIRVGKGKILVDCHAALSPIDLIFNNKAHMRRIQLISFVNFPARVFGLRC